MEHTSAHYRDWLDLGLCPTRYSVSPLELRPLPYEPAYEVADDDALNAFILQP